MSLHQLPARISTIKANLAQFLGWQLDAVKGYIYLRDGIDYVNNNNRYKHAYDYLDKAYRAAVVAHPQDATLLARLCLWKGIALNENEDLPKIQRNKKAIEQYKKGLDWIHYIRDANTMPIRMSLHNSYGVAIHHLNIGRGDHHIPKEAFYHYRTARALFYRNPEDSFIKRIMKKVETNTGYIIHRGGNTLSDNFIKTIYSRNDTC